ARTRSVVAHLKEKGPQLQHELNERSLHYARQLASHCGDALEVVSCGSILRVIVPAPEFADLLQYHLIDRGVYSRSFVRGYFINLSTAHTDEDLQFFERALVDSVNEMRHGGILD